MKKMECILIQDSILNCKVDAIVNPANPQLLRGGGLSGIIHEAAGDELFEYLKTWKRENKRPAILHGEAIISPSFNLQHKQIIHAVGAVWRDGSDEEKELLSTCYLNCLRLAEKHQLQSIAFPNISTGIYGFPKEVAAPIAINSIRSFDAKHLKEVYFVCFDKENFNLYDNILNH